ncbi:MAG: DUF434 domain-containing protein [Spirochaetaceae bacterium]
MSRESGDLRPELARAVADYALFVERGYPVKGVLKLVGDRHRLSGVERNILYRGVVSTALSERRTRRRLALPHELPRRSTLIVDGHNVIFTVVNYLQGRTAFLAVDGFLRDAGNPARRIRAGEEFGRAVEEIGRRLRSLEPARVVVYFDEPVTYSKDHIARARRAWAEVAPAVELHLVRSADQALKGSPEGVLLTSDSTLIDATSLPVADLPRWIIEEGFGARPARLAEWAGIHTDSRREGD